MQRSDETRELWSHVIETVNDIIQQRREPAEAARELDALRAELVLLGEALLPFVGLAAQWDYDVDHRYEHAHEIVRAAETLRRGFGPS